MNILFLIPSLSKGGQEKAGMLLCNYLSQFHNITVVCLESRQPDEFLYQSEIIRLEIPRKKTIAGKISVGSKRIKALKAIKKKLKTDISIAFGNTAIILNAMADNGEYKIISIRQSLSGARMDSSLKSKLHHRLYKWAIKKADKIVPVSKGINDELYKYFKIKNKFFIHNGYDFDEIKSKALETTSHSYENKSWIVHTGRFDISKGHWHLVKIFVEIKKKFSSAGLMLIGGVDQSSGTGIDIFNYCKLYIEQSGLKWSDEDPEADVLFLGHQENPFRFLAKARLFIMPSLWEGFPNSLVEAMICGLPVVAADCATGPGEILHDTTSGKDYGLLLPAFNDKFDKTDYNTTKLDYYWAEKISKLMSDNTAMQFFCQMSIERSREYSLDKYGRNWLHIIEEKEKTYQ